MRTASHLLWLDVETDSGPTIHDEVLDFSGVHIMEFAMLITDRSLNIDTDAGGYHEQLRMTRATADTLKANPEILTMHGHSGLIQECIASEVTLADVDAEADRILTGTGLNRGDLAIAGSGVAAFDLPLIRAKMPRLSAWLAYYPYDVGIFRRMTAAMADGYVVSPHLASYGEFKEHRAMADVVAHLREAQAFRDWVRSLPSD